MLNFFCFTGPSERDMVHRLKKMFYGVLPTVCTNYSVFEVLASEPEKHS